MFPRRYSVWRMSILPIATTIIAVLLLLPSTADAATSSNIWTVVKSPNVTTGTFANNTLLSVAALSDNNVWAVGFESQTGTSPDGDHPLIEHWDGSSWSISLAGTQTADLKSVSAVSANDVWTVGSILVDSETDAPLAEHWNGQAWSVVPMPTPTGSVSTSVNAVAAISATNAWAVGTFTKQILNASPVNVPLIEHWDGSTWSVTPNVPEEETDFTTLTGITAISANDVWAVGQFDGGTQVNLEMHWDGISWSLHSALINTGAGESGGVAAAVSAVSSTDVWAVGGVDVLSQDGVSSQQPFAIHWNGSQWTEVATPQPKIPSAAFAFTAVSALTQNDVWAVGVNAGNAFIEHWDGSRWSTAGTPTLGAGGSTLFGIAKSGATSLWAVGGNNPQSGLTTNTLTLHTTKG